MMAAPTSEVIERLNAISARIPVLMESYQRQAPHPAFVNIREAHDRLIQAGKCRNRERMLTCIEIAERHMDEAARLLEEQG